MTSATVKLKLKTENIKNKLNYRPSCTMLSPPRFSEDKKVYKYGFTQYNPLVSKSSNFNATLCSQINLEIKPYKQEINKFTQPLL